MEFKVQVLHLIDLILIKLVDVIAEGSYVCMYLHTYLYYSELDELLLSRRGEGTKKVIKSSGDIFQVFLTVKGLTLEDLKTRVQ